MGINFNNNQILKTYDNDKEDHKHVNWPLYVFATDGNAADAISVAAGSYSSALTPGSTLPSKYSSNAPPPVDT